MRRKIVLAVIVVVVGFNVWRQWIREPSDPATRAMGNVTYQASQLALAAEHDSTCTASLRGFRLEEPPPDSGGSRPWRDVKLYSAYTTPSAVDSGYGGRMYESGIWWTQTIYLERLELRVDRRLTDSARLAVLRYALSSGPEESGGSGDGLTDEVRLVLETAPTDSGPVVKGCYGMHRAVERCGELGGRVVTDEIGARTDRCTFVEGDSGRTMEDLLEKARQR